MQNSIWLDRLFVRLIGNILALLTLVFVLLYYSFWFIFPFLLWIYIGIYIRTSYVIFGNYIPYVFSLIIVVAPYAYIILRIPNVIDVINRFPLLLFELTMINSKDFDRALLFRRFDTLSADHLLALREPKIELIVKYPENDSDARQLAIHLQIRNAINKERFDMFKMLLNQIENIDEKKDDTKDGFRPLLFDVVEAGEYECVVSVLDRGAKINEPDNYRGKITVLHKACEMGHVEIVRLLLACGADVNVKDQWGYTPYWYASKCRGGFPKVVEMLVSNGAKIN